MRLPWRAREYQRVCRECGCTWTVPAFARRRRLNMVSRMIARPDQSGRADLSREVSSIEAANEASEALWRCPDCGSDRFTQHAAP